MRVFVYSFLVLLTACGFQSVHCSKCGPLPGQLASIQVADIPGREGQLLRIALEDRLNPQGAATSPAYDLRIALTKTLIPVIVRPDGSIERYNIRFRSNFSLIRVADGAEVLKGEVNRISSANVSEEDFASYVTREDAAQRTLAEIAEEYKFRLIAWLGQG